MHLTNLVAPLTMNKIAIEPSHRRSGHEQVGMRSGSDSKASLKHMPAIIIKKDSKIGVTVSYIWIDHSSTVADM